MLRIRNASKSYNGLRVIHGLSLEVAEGDFVAIVGPSGSGKTTLLNMTAGLLTPSEGEVVVGGTPIYQLDPKKRAAFRKDRFGFIFQQFNLIPYLSALENVEVPLFLAGRPVRKQQTTARELLEKVGLGGKLGRLPGELSVGEQQRVAVARALANDPQIILADEPTGNLDTRTGEEVMKHISQLNDDGRTVLLVTHDPRLVGYATRAVRIEDGRLR